MRRLPLFLMLSALSIPAVAELPQPTIEYSADSTTEADGMSIHTRVYHAVGKERREANVNGQRQVMILRHDKGVSWMLMPDSKQYMEMPVEMGAESSGDLAAYETRRTLIGKEKLNGLETTKYKANMSSPGGIQLDGFVWVTKQELVVKVDAEAKGAEAMGRMRMELTNIQIAPQDPKLFEIPADYKRYDVGSFEAAPVR